MKIHALILAFGGLVGAAAIAQAQTTTLPPGPLEKLQDAFGAIVGTNLRVPDQVLAPAGSPPVDPTIGRAYYESLAIPGAIFAAPYAAIDPDANAAPAPAAKGAPAARHHRHARGVHHPTPATAG